LQKKFNHKQTQLLNAVGSVGLALFMLAATFLDASRAHLAVLFLCLSMGFTGMHTPGCQAALVAIAPAFSVSLLTKKLKFKIKKLII
jgi:hypothetical protein